MERLRHTFLLLVFFLTACSSQSPDIIHNYRAEVINAKWTHGTHLSIPNLFFLIGEQGSIVYSSDGLNWHYGLTPNINTLHDITSNQSQTVMVAVGEGGTVLRSTDNGKTWYRAAIELPDQLNISLTRFNSVAYIAKSDVWLAAGTQSAIVRSSDDGLTWEVVSYNTRESRLEILDLFVESQSGDIFFAAQQATTGRSSDGGLTWSFNKHDIETSGSYIPHIVNFHHFRNTLVAAADNGHLLLSKDRGLTWKITKIQTAGYFTDSAYDPHNNVFALTTQMGEIAISKDEGKTWNLVSFKVRNWPSNDIPLLSRIIFDKKSKSFLVVGNSGVIARSDDGGKSWHADIFKPLFNASVTTLLHDSNNGISVIAGSGGSIAYTKSLGVTSLPLHYWKSVKPAIEQYIRKVLHLPDSNSFVAVGQLGGIWRSHDDGHSWKVIKVSYPYQNQPPHLRDVVLDPESQALIAAGPTGSIIRSSDNGLSWQVVFQGKIQKGEAFTQLLYDKQRKTYYACEVLYRSVYKSIDHGISWKKITTIDSAGRNLWHGAISETLNLMMLIGESGGIAISRDGGANWQMADTNITDDLYGAYTDTDINALLAVGDNGVILRSENGIDWKTVNSGTDSALRRIAKVPAGDALIAFGQNGTIMRSTDAGLHWSRAHVPAYSGELRTAFVDHRSSNIFVFGRDGGILQSTDQGKNWKIINSHTAQHFRSAALNPDTDTIVSVGEGLVRLKVIHQTP
jgi:photosystem II stability/assembly factor-like uncharacterized protein